MSDEPARAKSSGTQARRGRRFKRHEIELADGGRLVLGVDGSIDQVDDQGLTTHSWTPDDPDWPDHAIRFGLHPQTPTVAPQRGRIPGVKPPRW